MSPTPTAPTSPPPPLTANDSVIIIGASHSGVACADRLRQLGFQGSITLIDRVPDLPVQRPPLSKHFLTNSDMAVKLLRDKEWFHAHNITLISGHEVVDAACHADIGGSITLADGSQHTWQRLVLATGANPRRLPLLAKGDNIYVLRNRLDASRLRQGLQASQHIAIIGGGYIGLEVAASARSLGKQVTLIEAQNRLLRRVASVAAAEFFYQLHQQHGVAIHTNASLEAMPNPTTLAFHSNGGSRSLAADLIVLGVGVVPDIILAEKLGLGLGDGIMTDADYRTSQPAIFAIGDGALPRGGYAGGRVRLESVHHAQMSGEIAAAAMLAEAGSAVPSHEVPWFWSNQYDIRLQSAGLVQPHKNAGDSGDIETITRIKSAGDTGKQQLSFWTFAGKRLLAVEAINDSQAYIVGRGILGKDPTAITRAMLADSNTDLKTLMAK